MSDHTKEPFTAKDLRQQLAHADRCVNALAGLHPEHVGELVEMLAEVTNALELYHAMLCDKPAEECVVAALLARAEHLLAEVKVKK